MIRIRQVAPAKVNLFLHVVGRRADGYHLLESLAAFAELGDVVEVSALPVGTVIEEGRTTVVRGPFARALEEALPPGAKLSMETACAIASEAAAPRRFRVVVDLDKHLPVAAGLGGGTADGAAVLRALADAFGLGWTAERTAAEAIRLGADGPACALGRALVMRGVGEALSPLALWPTLDVVLVNPLKPAETRAVFRAHAARGARFTEPYPDPPETDDLEEAVAYLAGARNDLTEAAVAVEPEIAEILAVLARQPGARLARLSGSGATCWAVFDAAAAALRAAAGLQAERPHWWVAATRLGGAV